jgi:pimeloyl-ACP methyl ester carboxylesterase
MREFATATGTIAYWVLEPEQPPADGAPAETVLLIHNFMSTARMAWGTIAETLQARYRVILLDLPGHGQSHGYPEGYAYREMAQQIAALAEAEDAFHAHVAGASAGGMIALWLLQDELMDPATLSLVSSTYSVNPATTGVATSLRPENFRAGGNWLEATARLHDPYQGEGYFDRSLLPSFRTTTTTRAIDLPAHALAHFSLPTCVIHGEEDEIFPVEIARQLAQSLPNSELHTIPGQGHALIFRQSRKVGELLADFLARHPQPLRAPRPSAPTL